MSTLKSLWMLEAFDGKRRWTVFDDEVPFASREDAEEFSEIWHECHPEINYTPVKFVRSE